MMEESTHLLFDGKKMIISPNIAPVFRFLMEIEKEIESFLGFNKKLIDISRDWVEIFKFVTFLNNKLKENNIDYKYEFKEHPEKFAGRLNFDIPLRSQIIVLFASLDVLFNLHTAYENETDGEKQLRDLTMDTPNAKNFLNQFLLNEENEYYKINKVRLSRIDAVKLRNLRNSLTHFFSVAGGGLSLAPGILEEKTRKLEKLLKQNKQGHVTFISPEDLYGLIKDANRLRMKKMSSDFQKNPSDFKRKIQFVINLVKEHGAVILFSKDLNIK